MTRNQMRGILTVAEIKRLCLARYMAEQSRYAELTARVQSALDVKTEEENPVTAMIKNKMADIFSDLAACRLYLDQDATPLLSPQDYERFIPWVVESAEARGVKFDGPEDSERFGRSVIESMKEYSSKVYGVMSSMINPYDEYWRWINTVFDLTDERGILPLTFGPVVDEITRRMYTSEEYTILFGKILNELNSVDMTKGILLSSMFDMLGKDDMEGRSMLELEFEENVMPLLHEISEKIKAVANAWLNEEVARIYVVK